MTNAGLRLSRSFFWTLFISTSTLAESSSRFLQAGSSSLLTIPETLSERHRVAKRKPSKAYINTIVTPRGGQDAPHGLKFAVCAGIVLAFNSGYVNGCCLSGGVAADNTPQAVAALTGAWTTSAFGLARHNYKQFRTQVAIILSFISGSTIAGMLNPRPAVFGGKISPSCGPAFLIGAVLLFASSFLAKNNYPNLSFFCLAAIANGMQNSITSVHTGNLIRTSHYTGISSDIGTFLGQNLRGNHQNLWKLKIFVALALSFWVGGFISFSATNAFASSSLLFSAFLYLVIGSGLILHEMRAPGPKADQIDMKSE